MFFHSSLYQVLPQIQELILVLDITFVQIQFQDLYICNLPNFPAGKFFSIETINTINKHELFLWSLMGISDLLVSIFLLVCIAKSLRIVTLPAFFVWSIAFLADLAVHVLTNSEMSDFVFSGTNYMTSRCKVIYCLIILVTHSTLGVNTFFIILVW